MAKTIKIGGRIESTETGNVVTGANAILDDTKGKKQNVINADVDAELLRLENAKQDNLTFDNAPTENSTNPVKSGGVYAADKALSDAIEAILLLIPSTATSLNKLVDTALMNSSIATNTATFRGTSASGLTEEQFLAWANTLEHDNNDYVFWQTVDADGNTLFKRYKYVTGTGWVYEYTLNNSSFTAAQWAAIESGITAALVSKINGLPNATELAQLFDAKQNVLTFDNAPTSGSSNPVKSSGVYTAIGDEAQARSDADTILDGKISDEATARGNADDALQQSINGLGSSVTTIEGKIPAGASPSNKMVDYNSMVAYIATLVEAMTASYTISTSDGHVSVTLTQVNGKITNFTLSTDDIASAQALSGLTNRVSTAESNISSLSGRVSINETDIADLQLLYNGLQQSKPVPVTSLPSSGQQQGAIYRLAGVSSYSDYMWNGSSWVLMATYNNAIDDLPIPSSNNLVKSGGVALKQVMLDANMMKNSNGEVIPVEAWNIRGLLKSSNGTVDTNANVQDYGTSDFVNISNYTKIKCKNLFPKAGNWAGLCAYNAQKEFLDSYNTGSGGFNGTVNVSSLPVGTVYIRFSSFYGYGSIYGCNITLFNDTLENYDMSFINRAIGTEQEYQFGDYTSTPSSDLTFDVTHLVTVVNSRCTKSGILKEVHFYASGTGTYQFYVGLLDQRNLLVNERPFSVVASAAGLNVVDVSSQNISIKKDEQVFFVCNANDIGSKYSKALSAVPNQCAIARGLTGVYTTYAETAPSTFPYGLVIGFGYKVNSINGSMFALNGDLEATNEEVASLASQVASAGIVYDNNGNPYRIMVANGQLVPKSLIYSKVVALGNSLTDHGVAPSIGWYGGRYSMASTRKMVSWTSQLERILKGYNTNATVKPFNIFAWEQNPQIDPSMITFDGENLDDILTNDVDCVIFRAGENNAITEQTQESYELALTNLVNYIKSKCPIASIIITSLMWPNTTKDTAFHNVATAMGLQYVSSGSVGSHSESLGDICRNAEETDVFAIINGGVAAHMNDYGFYLFTNILATAFGLTNLNEAHSITVSGSAQYFLNENTGVKGGVITIQTFGVSQPSITVADAGGNPVTVSHFDISSYGFSSGATWASYFIMPNSDVTITLT